MTWPSPGPPSPWSRCRSWVYRDGGAAVLHGHSPYVFVNRHHVVFTYPPIAAVVFVPLALMSMDFAVAVVTFMSITALELVVWLILRRAHSALPTTLAVLPLLPVSLTLWNGQVDLLLMLLLLADLLGPPARRSGLGVGLAAGVKLPPAPPALDVLLGRRLRRHRPVLHRLPALPVHPPRTPPLDQPPEKQPQHPRPALPL